MIADGQGFGVTGFPATQFLKESGRRDEVQRLAQGAAASQSISAGLPIQPQNGNSAPRDSTQLSAEAIEQISGSAPSEKSPRMDQLVMALQEAFRLKSEPGPTDSPRQETSGDFLQPVTSR